MNRTESSRAPGVSTPPRRQMMIAPTEIETSDHGWLARLATRQLETDVMVLDEAWLRDSGVQRQLEFEGFQLRWVTSGRVGSNVSDGWSYATVSHLLWWQRRIRRRHGKETQYLLKRVKSLR